MTIDKIDPRFVGLIEAMMALHKAQGHIGQPETAIAGWTENEQAQAFDYARAVVRNFLPWWKAFKKAKKRIKAQP